VPKLTFAPKGIKDIRSGKNWYVVQTPHYIILFDAVARKLQNPERFGAAAERRLKVIAALLGLKRERSTRRYPIRSVIPYFMHDPSKLSYGNVEFQGIDVNAGESDRLFQHEEAHAILGQVAGCPPSLFNEGFATFASDPSSVVNDRCSLTGIRNEVVPSLVQIASFEDFWRHWKTYKPFMYRISASFVSYLFSTRGPCPFLEFVRCTSQAAPKEVLLRSFRAAYGCSLHVAERRWKAYLNDKSRSLRMSRKRRIGDITEKEWADSRVQMVRDALDAGR